MKSTDRISSTVKMKTQRDSTPEIISQSRGAVQKRQISQQPQKPAPSDFAGAPQVKSPIKVNMTQLSQKKIFDTPKDTIVARSRSNLPTTKLEREESGALNQAIYRKLFEKFSERSESPQFAGSPRRVQVDINEVFRLKQQLIDKYDEHVQSKRRLSLQNLLVKQQLNSKIERTKTKIGVAEEQGIHHEERKLSKSDIDDFLRRVDQCEERKERELSRAINQSSVEHPQWQILPKSKMIFSRSLDRKAFQETFQSARKIKPLFEPLNITPQRENSISRTDSKQNSLANERLFRSALAQQERGEIIKFEIDKIQESIREVIKQAPLTQSHLVAKIKKRVNKIFDKQFESIKLPDDKIDMGVFLRLLGATTFSAVDKIVVRNHTNLKQNLATFVLAILDLNSALNSEKPRWSQFIINKMLSEDKVKSAAKIVSFPELIRFTLAQERRMQQHFVEFAELLRKKRPRVPKSRTALGSPKQSQNIYQSTDGNLRQMIFQIQPAQSNDTLKQERESYLNQLIDKNVKIVLAEQASLQKRLTEADLRRAVKSQLQSGENLELFNALATERTPEAGTLKSRNTPIVYSSLTEKQLKTVRNKQGPSLKQMMQQNTKRPSLKFNSVATSPRSSLNKQYDAAAAVAAQNLLDKYVMQSGRTSKASTTNTKRQPLTQKIKKAPTTAIINLLENRQPIFTEMNSKVQQIMPTQQSGQDQDGGLPDDKKSAPINNSESLPVLSIEIKQPNDSSDLQQSLSKTKLTPDNNGIEIETLRQVQSTRQFENENLSDHDQQSRPSETIEQRRDTEPPLPEKLPEQIMTQVLVVEPVAKEMAVTIENQEPRQFESSQNSFVSQNQGQQMQEQGSTEVLKEQVDYPEDITIQTEVQPEPEVDQKHALDAEVSQDYVNSKTDNTEDQNEDFLKNQKEQSPTQEIVQQPVILVEEAPVYQNHHIFDHEVEREPIEIKQMQERRFSDISQRSKSKFSNDSIRSSEHYQELVGGGSFSGNDRQFLPQQDQVDLDDKFTITEVGMIDRVRETSVNLENRSFMTFSQPCLNQETQESNSIQRLESQQLVLSALNFIQEIPTVKVDFVLQKEADSEDKKDSSPRLSVHSNPESAPHSETSFEKYKRQNRSPRQTDDKNVGKQSNSPKKSEILIKYTPKHASPKKVQNSDYHSSQSEAQLDVNDLQNEIMQPQGQQIEQLQVIKVVDSKRSSSIVLEPEVSPLSAIQDANKLFYLFHNLSFENDAKDSSQNSNHQTCEFQNTELGKQTSDQRTDKKTEQYFQQQEYQESKFPKDESEVDQEFEQPEEVKGIQQVVGTQQDQMLIIESDSENLSLPDPIASQLTPPTQTEEALIQDQKQKESIQEQLQAIKKGFAQYLQKKDEIAEVKTQKSNQPSTFDQVSTNLNSMFKRVQERIKKPKEDQSNTETGEPQTQQNGFLKQTYDKIKQSSQPDLSKTSDSFKDTFKSIQDKVSLSLPSGLFQTITNKIPKNLVKSIQDQLPQSSTIIDNITSTVQNYNQDDLAQKIVASVQESTLKQLKDSAIGQLLPFVTSQYKLTSDIPFSQGGDATLLNDNFIDKMALVLDKLDLEYEQEMKSIPEPVSSQSPKRSRLDNEVLLLKQNSSMKHQSDRTPSSKKKSKSNLSRLTAPQTSFKPKTESAHKQKKAAPQKQVNNANSPSTHHSFPSRIVDAPEIMFFMASWFQIRGKRTKN